VSTSALCLTSFDVYFSTCCVLTFYLSIVWYSAVMQKGRPIPAELPMSVIPPSKRPLLKERGGGFF